MFQTDISNTVRQRDARCLAWRSRKRSPNHISFFEWLISSGQRESYCVLRSRIRENKWFQSTFTLDCQYIQTHRHHELQGTPLKYLLGHSHESADA